MIDGRDFRPLTPRRERLDCCQVSPASIVRFLRGPSQVLSSRSRPSLVSRIQLQGKRQILTTSMREAQHPGVVKDKLLRHHALQPQAWIEANTKLVLQVWW